MNKLTDSQYDAVNIRDRNILVAASAGTGKTYAMISRVLEIIMGRCNVNGISKEEKAKRVPVNRILLMTYTVAASKEMKIRLNDFLIEELNKITGQDDESKEKRHYLTEQLDLVPLADISTIHAFAADKLKKYFQEVNLNPLFDIADEQDEAVYRKDAILKTFNELEKDERLQNLRELFSVKLKDDNLEKVIFDVYKYANCLENADEWLDGISMSQYTGDFEKTKVFDIYIKNIKSDADNLLKKMIETVFLAENSGDNKYAEWLKSVIPVIGEFVKIESLDDLIGLSRKPQVDTGTSPNLKKGTTIKEIKAALKARINSFYSDNLLEGEVDRDTIINEVRKVGDIAGNVLFLVKRFSENYSKIKEKENKMTFQDLERAMAELLSKDEIAKELRSKYDYILIDEYQDINYLQEYIIGRISNGSNLFMVGDSKQSIYRFRQAVPEIFIDKADRYSRSDGGFTTSFNQNFRSRKAILDFVNGVFSNIMTAEFGKVDYRKSAMLVTDPDDDGRYSLCNQYPAVSVMTYKGVSRVKDNKVFDVYSVKEHDIDSEDEIKNAHIEADIIYREIMRLKGTRYYDPKESCDKIIGFSDIAILFQSRGSNSYAILDRLTDMKIPLNVSTFKKEDRSDEVRLLVNLLRVIDNFRQDIPLAAVMRSYFGKFSDDELVKIRLYDRDRNKFFHEVLDKVTESGLREKVDKLLNFIKKYRIKSSYMPVFELLREIIGETGFDRYILAHENGEMKYKGITDFIYSLKDKSYAGSISRFLFHFDSIEDVQSSAQSSIGGEEAVTVSTMHGVKGLEYPVVIFASASSHFLNKSKEYVTDNELGLTFKFYDTEERTKKDNIVYAVMNRKRKFKEQEDRLNLLYVALTRAKNHLIITGKETKNLECKIEPEKAGCYLDLIAYGINQENYFSFDPEDMGKTEMPTGDVRKFAYFREKGNPLFVEEIKKMLKDDYSYKDSTLTGIKYSVSAINKSADREDVYVPSLFDEEGRLQGTAAHKVLQHIDFKCDTDEEINEEFARLLDEKIITEEEAAQTDKGEILKCLNSPVIRYAADRKILREQTFMLKLPANELLEGVNSTDEVLLQGTIDLIILGDENIIVDYKRTGVLDEEVIRNRYRRQLELYKIASERILDIKIDKTIIYLLGQNKEIEV